MFLNKLRKDENQQENKDNKSLNNKVELNCWDGVFCNEIKGEFWEVREFHKVLNKSEEI